MIPTRPLKDVAAEVGCSRRGVQHARASGRLPARFFVRIHGRWHLRADRFEACCEAMRATYGTGKRPLDGPTPENPYAEARTRRMRYQARKAELEYERLRDSLLPTDAVVRWYTDRVQRVTERVLEVSGRLAPTLVGLEAGEIETILEAEFRTTLRDLRTELEDPEARAQLQSADLVL